MEGWKTRLRKKTPVSTVTICEKTKAFAKIHTNETRKDVNAKHIKFQASKKLKEMCC